MKSTGRLYQRAALTLVELLVIVAIGGMVLCLLLPAVRTSREPSRRNSCINNVKQLSLGILNHHDTRKSFPLASTAPLITADGVPQHGAVGTASPSAESPTNWTAGQQGDGYSWIAQCLPYVEENTLYEKITAAQDKPVRRYGKLADAAFAPSSNLKLEAAATSDSPFLWSTKIATFVCASFPSEDDVDSFASIPKSKVGTGNYVALAATHYRLSPVNHLESLFPGGEVPTSAGRDCANVPYCGNGGLPFPGVMGGKVQKVGLRVQDYRGGMSKVALITETREEYLTSWYSGLASYVVATLPPPNGDDPVGVEVAPAEFTWKCDPTTKCELALNRGDQKLGTPSRYYQPVSPHGGGPRIWGPSSRHPGVVVHGFADAHTESIKDDVDSTVYLQLVQRDSLK